MLPAWRLVTRTWIEICASLNRRKKKKSRALSAASSKAYRKHNCYQFAFHDCIFGNFSNDQFNLIVYVSEKGQSIAPHLWRIVSGDGRSQTSRHILNEGKASLMEHFSFFPVCKVWCIARQADRDGETVKHFHNCMKMLLRFRTTSNRQFLPKFSKTCSVECISWVRPWLLSKIMSQFVFPLKTMTIQCFFLYRSWQCLLEKKCPALKTCRYVDGLLCKFS